MVAVFPRRTSLAPDLQRFSENWPPRYSVAPSLSWASLLGVEVTSQSPLREVCNDIRYFDISVYEAQIIPGEHYRGARITLSESNTTLGGLMICDEGG